MRILTMLMVLSILFVLCASAAQDPARPIDEKATVRVRLKTGEELVGRILRKESQGIVLAAEAGNQVTIRELANADIETITSAFGLRRLSNVSEFAHHISPGARVRLGLVNGEKLEGKLLRTSALDLELDLTRGRQRELRLVAYSEIRQIQLKEPRSSGPHLLAVAPSLIYLALRVASAF